MLKKQRWTTKATGQDKPAAEMFCSLEKVFALSGTPVAGDSESIVFRVNVGENAYYVKRYHKTKGIRSWFGLSRIRREAENQLLFKRLDANDDGTDDGITLEGGSEGGGWGWGGRI